jgi:hypothetical protein
MAASLVNFGKKLAFHISLLHFQLGISLTNFVDVLQIDHTQIRMPGSVAATRFKSPLATTFQLVADNCWHIGFTSQMNLQQKDCLTHDKSKLVCALASILYACTLCRFHVSGFSPDSTSSVIFLNFLPKLTYVQIYSGFAPHVTPCAGVLKTLSWYIMYFLGYIRVCSTISN